LTLDHVFDFIGPVFEEITRQYLRRLNAKGKLPFVAKSFGRWWGKDGQGAPMEVDVVVESVTGKELIIGECKWRNTFKVNKTIDVLRERASFFDQYDCRKYLFTKAPAEVGKTHDIVNVSMHEYFCID
jgi:AAA+ ATPase superfamily predicted ATPase